MKALRLQLPCLSWLEKTNPTLNQSLFSLRGEQSRAVKEESKANEIEDLLLRELLSVLEYSFFFFALHKYKWSVPSRGEKPVARLVSEYAQEMDIQNVPLLTPEQYLDEIATHLEFKCFNHGIETLPGGHSWTELAQSVISSRNADLTDLSTLTYVHALLLEGGYD
ncbi:hypothetical protein ACH5RR_003147 [Cinchona calisaya]|uniref:Uncharacterized protein n=1 Tax=Cinchona calisaya TaxID=153742 RepID=A0ABD3AU12_9GENT